jgi:hypothetical protein
MSEAPPVPGKFHSRLRTYDCVYTLTDAARHCSRIEIE